MHAKTDKQTEIEDADRDDFEDDDEQEEMSEQDLEGFLAEAIEAFADESDEVDHADVATFRDCGVLTMNRGLVVTIGDSEFQLTIVRSR
jgi:hypothetical protein